MKKLVLLAATVAVLVMPSSAAAEILILDPGGVPHCPPKAGSHVCDPA